MNVFHFEHANVHLTSEAFLTASLSPNTVSIVHLQHGLFQKAAGFAEN